MENDTIQQNTLKNDDDDDDDDDDIKNKRNAKRQIDCESCKINIKIWVYRKC
jgi:hypothetical protein